MKVFKAVIYIFAAIALLTGASDLIQGLESQRGYGATLTDQGFADPMVNNVFRFFSGLWFGTGILFLLFVRDLDRYKPALIALLSVVVIGGLGRVLSIVQLGMPENSSGYALVIVGLIAELVISPILIAWLLFKYQGVKYTSN